MVVAAVAEEQQGRLFPVEQRGQPEEAVRAHLARHAGIDHGAADQAGEHLGVALAGAGAGAEGEAVTEGEHHRVRGQRLQFGRRRAAGQDQAKDPGGQQPAGQGGGGVGHGVEIHLASSPSSASLTTAGGGAGCWRDRVM